MQFSKICFIDFIRKYLHIYLRVIFVANFLLLVVIATFCFFLPKQFEGTTEVNLALVLAGCYWYAIMILSAIGAFKPSYMEPIVILQLIYKFLYVIYYAAGYNQFKFAPYGYIFCFFIPWIVLILIYLSLRLFIFLNDRKNKKMVKDTNEA